MPMSNLSPFNDPIMSSSGTPMMTTMAPTPLPAQGNVPPGYGADPFIREQLHQAQVLSRQAPGSIAPLSKIQHLIDVLGAARLLEEIVLDSLFTLDLPNTNKVALVVPLSHIARFKEKPPFKGKADRCWTMVHGTNIIGAKYSLAEALVRPADWTYCEQLHKSELPTYGCFSLGAEISSREKDIPRWNLSDLLDRASKWGKGQQEILLALVYKGGGQHLALKAEGNDLVQTKCASNGVITTAEKYTVARSEHCTASPSQRNLPPSRPITPASASPTQDETRVYGFDANEHWQADATHHDCHKVNGLTFPRTIRSSAFTQRFDIEGCDPLALPVTALLYQQADNFGLRKFAHGRELYLIPTGDIAAVVFGTELLSQLRNRGIDLDRVSHCRARQDRQTLDKINNTKYAAKLVAEHIQQWLPMKATDPSSQHTITQLQQQLAELKQRLGDPSDSAPPDSATPPPPSTSSPSAPPPSTPIHRALHGNAAAPPPEFEPASLHVAPITSNSWLAANAPTSVAPRTYNQWFKDLNLTPAQRSTLERNLSKAEEWWHNQPDSAVDTVQRTAIMMGLPLSILKGNFNDGNLIRILTIAITMSC
eukprot:s357_g39.t1